MVQREVQFKVVGMCIHAEPGKISFHNLEHMSGTAYVSFCVLCALLASARSLSTQAITAGSFCTEPGTKTHTTYIDIHTHTPIIMS